MIGIGIGIDGPTFKPSDVAGLALDLDAAVVTKSGANVTTWPDQSGNGFDLNAQDGTNAWSATGGPNNTPAIAFSNGPLKRAAALIGGADAARTMFLVLQTSSSAGQVAMIDGAAGSGGFGYAINESAANKRDIYVAGVAFSTDTTSDYAGAWEKVSCINSHLGHVNGNQRLRVGGIAHTLSASNNVALASITSFSMGGATGFASLKFIGSIARVLIYTGVIADADIARIEAYLLDKYGV